MNDKNMYAYMLLGAVLLAGLAGYMMSESDNSNYIELPSEGSYNIVVDVITGENTVTENSNVEDSDGS